MANPHRDIVQAIHDLIVNNVAEAAGWTTYVEEPVRHDPNGAHLAVWFEGYAEDPARNATQSQAYDDLYGVRYWERAASKPRKVNDEDAADAIEDLMDRVAAVIRANPVSIGTSYYTRVTGAQKFIGQDIGSKTGGQVAGFEVAVKASRYEDLN